MAGFFSTMESWTLEAITLAHLLMFSPKVYMRDERLERMHKKTMKKREKKRTAGNLLRHLLMHHQLLTPLSLSSLSLCSRCAHLCLSVSPYCLVHPFHLSLLIRYSVLLLLLFFSLLRLCPFSSTGSAHTHNQQHKSTHMCKLLHSVKRQND